MGKSNQWRCLDILELQGPNASQRAPNALAGTGIGFDAAAILPEVRSIGIHGLPPPAAIGVAGDACVVGAGQLQAEASPLQHDEGPWHGASFAIWNLAGINGTVMERGLQAIAITQVVLGHGRRPGRWSDEEQQQNQDQGEQASHGVGVVMDMMAE